MYFYLNTFVFFLLYSEGTDGSFLKHFNTYRKISAFLMSPFYWNSFKWFIGHEIPLCVFLLYMTFVMSWQLDEQSRISWIWNSAFGPNKNQIFNLMQKYRIMPRDLVSCGIWTWTETTQTLGEQRVWEPWKLERRPLKVSERYAVLQLGWQRAIHWEPVSSPLTQVLSCQDSEGYIAFHLAT